MQEQKEAHFSLVKLLFFCIASLIMKFGTKVK